MKKIKIFALIFLHFSLINIKAQQANIATGGDALGSGGTIAYSVGQIVYTSNSSIVGSLVQGVQQPYEISIILGLEDNQINININAYPNPTNNLIILNVGNLELSNLNFHLFDTNGNLIESKKITNVSEYINLDNLVNSIYFLKVTANSKEVKTFKIIKN